MAFSTMWGGDPDESHERFDEAFQILMQGLMSDFLTFHGKHDQYDGLWMELKPRQTPYPPLWYAGNPTHAAEYGAHLITAGLTANLPEIAAHYRGVWQHQIEAADEGLPRLADPLYGAIKRVFIAETDDEGLK